MLGVTFTIRSRAIHIRRLCLQANKRVEQATTLAARSFMMSADELVQKHG